MPDSSSADSPTAESPAADATTGESTTTESPTAESTTAESAADGNETAEESVATGDETAADNPTAITHSLQAIRGALGFLTRFPVGTTVTQWEAFRRTAYSFPLVGYLIGVLAGSVFFLSLQPPTLVAAYLVVIYLSTGLTHADGLADVGDALAVHDDREKRLAVLKDSATGVGGLLVLGLTLIVTALGALAFAGVASQSAFRLVVATEVGAKLGMALVICYGSPAHEGLGSQLVEPLGQRAFLPALLLAVPVLVFPPTGMAPALLAAVVAGPLVGVAAVTWGHRAIGGVNGDLIGATNEVGRAVGLHLGVSAWILL